MHWELRFTKELKGEVIQIKRKNPNSSYLTVGYQLETGLFVDMYGILCGERL